MCGILGISINKNSSIKHRRLCSAILDKLFLLAESRGKEASGFAFNSGGSIVVHKTPFPASSLIKSDIYKSSVKTLLSHNDKCISAIGHSRLVTNGYEQFNANNQPVIKKGVVCVHNGIIVNQKELWEKFADEEKLTDLDSELIPTLLMRFYKEKKTINQALSELYSEIYGMTNIAAIFSEYNNLLLATNNGSIYYVTGNSGNEIVFASERYILNKLLDDLNLHEVFNKENILQLKPGTACLVNLDDFSRQSFAFNDPAALQLSQYGKALPVEEVAGNFENKRIHINTSLEHKAVTVSEEFIGHYQACAGRIAELKRCSTCLLPETFPFIEFDEKGECNYCKNYSKNIVLGEDELSKVADKFRSKDGSPDCLIPFSGGRDSSFALHYIKNILKMNPIAFSYDWGMLTDLARRNQARMCGSLGVEHILVSADIRRKRENIRKNVAAWLKRPSLGTIPLFMAGDKQYFYFANLLMDQNNLGVTVMGENMLETTRFKSGFCGIKPHFGSDHTYTLSKLSKAKMMFFYGKEYLLNPAYLNSSLLDTIDAFKSYYLIKHRNINIFNYLKWDEKLIESTLINDYRWETDPETRTTWRIGDGTASFYNYIYYIVAGFTENDTFRSNQIREGAISRDKALETVNEENRPRWNSIKWYLDTIGLEFEPVVKRINGINTLYAKR